MSCQYFVEMYSFNHRCIGHHRKSPIPELLRNLRLMIVDVLAVPLPPGYENRALARLECHQGRTDASMRDDRIRLLHKRAELVWSDHSLYSCAWPVNSCAFRSSLHHHLNMSRQYLL